MFKKKYLFPPSIQIYILVDIGIQMQVYIVLDTRWRMCVCVFVQCDVLGHPSQYIPSPELLQSRQHEWMLLSLHFL